MTTRQASPDQIDQALTTADTILRLASQANQDFVAMEHVIQALALGFASGNNVIILGPPGTGKSMSTSYMARALGASYWHKALKAGTTDEDLYGPLSATKLQKDVYTRKWAGMATAKVVFLDEIGKASDTVRDEILEAIEERELTTPDETWQMPLHLAVSASNETIDHQEAVWDRFTIRTRIDNVDGSRDFLSLLDKTNIDVPEGYQVADDDLTNIKFVALDMLRETPSTVKHTLTDIRSKLATVHRDRISNRRWLNVLRVAAGQALLAGRATLSVADLEVAEYLLWSNVDHIEKVGELVKITVDEQMQKAAAAEMVVVELEEASKNLDGTMEAIARLRFKTQSLLEQMQSDTDTDWGDLPARVQAIRTQHGFS